MRGRNALQAILAGLSGGLEGQASQRAFEDERRRLEQDRLDRLGREAVASERQAVMDQVALTEKGYVEQGARADTIKRAAPALDAAVANATSVLSGAAPTRDMNTPALRAAAGQFGTPVSSVNVGGKTFELAQNPIQRATMLAEQQAERARSEAQMERRAKMGEKDAELSAQRQAIASAFPKLKPAEADAVARGVAQVEDFPAYAKPDRSGSLTPFQATERADEQAANEAMGNAFLDQNRQNPQVISAIGTLLASNPTFRNRPGLAGYALMQQQSQSVKTDATEAQVSQREAAAEAARARTANIGKTGNDYLSRVRAERAGAPAAPSAPAVDKDTQRADRWDAIKAANPNMSDDAITAQVMREIP